MATTTIAQSELFDYHINDAAGINPTKIAERAAVRLDVPLTSFRKTAAVDTNSPGTSSGTDLGLITGTYASAPSYIGTSDLKTVVGPTTRTARVLVPIPWNYKTTRALILRAIAGMKTTIADASATILVAASRVNADGTVGANIVTSAVAVTMNSLTASNKDWVLDQTTLVAGDVLDVRVTIAVSDAASVTAVIAALWKLELLANVQ